MATAYNIYTDSGKRFLTCLKSGGGIKFFYFFYTDAYDSIITIREKETSKFIR